MATASLTRSLSYRSVDNVLTNAASVSVSSSYSLGAQHSDSGIDVPDAAADNTEYSLAFGTIANATLLEVRNNTGQTLKVNINGHTEEATLVAGTVTVAMASIDGEILSVVAGADNGGTPGILSVRRSAGNLIVESWLAATGIQALDVSDVTIIQTAPIPLVDDGMMIIANPSAPAIALSKATVVLTGIQSGAGQVAYKIFGDPV
jgi:uncharacterized protein YwlG (UPF0340 family)